MAAIQAEGKLVVGARFDLAGFGVKNPTSGAMEGVDVEIAKLIAAGIFDGTHAMSSGRSTSRTPSRGTREASIKDGRVDFAIPAYRITDAAKQQVDFAGPYFVAGQDLLVRSGDTPIKGFPTSAARGSAPPG